MTFRLTEFDERLGFRATNIWLLMEPMDRSRYCNYYAALHKSLSAPSITERSLAR